MRLCLLAVAVLSGSLCLAQDQQTPSPKKQPTQQTSGNQLPPAAQRNVNGKAPAKSAPSQVGAKPETGKTGGHATALADTTTKSAGVETPPYQTTTGVAQQPGKQTTNWSAEPNPRSRPGAPPNFGQVGQMQEHADANAAKAIEAEVGGAPGGGTLGINNVMPRYSASGGGTNTRQSQQTSTEGQTSKGKPAAKPTPTPPKQ